MKLDHFTAIEVSIAIGVVVENAITWRVKISKGMQKGNVWATEALTFTT